MKDNRKIEAEKKVIKSMIDFINGKDIKKLINGNYITITKSTGIESLFIYNIFKRKNKPKPTKNER